MKPLSVVVAQRSNETLDSLSKSLNNHFRVVTPAAGLDEILQCHSWPGLLMRPLLILKF